MRSKVPGWHLVPVFALILLLALPAGPALGQDAGAVISVDRPGNGQTAELGRDVVFGGWAADWSSMGTGIDRVVVYDAPIASGGKIIAEAVYGTARADVAAAFDSAWLNSEFTATWPATGSAGNRTFWIYAHSVDDDGWTNQTVTIQLVPATVAAPMLEPVAAQPTTNYENPAVGQNPQMQQLPNDFRQQMPGQYGAMPGQYGPMQRQYGPQQGNAYLPQMPRQYGPQYPGQFGSPYSPNGMPFNGQNNGQSGAQPVSVTVAGQNASSVSLSWAPIPMPGITGYQTSQSLTATGPFIPSVVAGSGLTGATVQGLQPNTTYYFQVAAVGNNSVQPPSAVVSATTTF